MLFRSESLGLISPTILTSGHPIWSFSCSFATIVSIISCPLPRTSSFCFTVEAVCIRGLILNLPVYLFLIVAELSLVGQSIAASATLSRKAAKRFSFWPRNKAGLAKAERCPHLPPPLALFLYCKDSGCPSPSLGDVLIMRLD